MSPNQITRSQIRHWARTGQLTEERIRAIEAAQRTGQIVDDGGNVPIQPLVVDPQSPRTAGTEIVPQRIEVREQKIPWFGWQVELERARRRGDL